MVKWPDHSRSLEGRELFKLIGQTYQHAGLRGTVASLFETSKFLRNKPTQYLPNNIMVRPQQETAAILTL